MRDVIFISHATPGDNEFVRWLALKLQCQGYHVWFDLDGLRGGADFWKKIEDVIRRHTVKFVVVMSKASNQAEGVRMELAVAAKVRKEIGDEEFIVPLRIDELSYGEFNIEMVRKTAIPFDKAWDGGLNQLLKEFEEGGVPRSNEEHGPEAVCTWWRTRFSAVNGLKEEEEDYLTNWFRAQLPAELYFWHLDGCCKVDRTDLAFPGAIHGEHVVSFAQRKDATHGGRGLQLKHSISVPTKDLVSGASLPLGLKRREANNIVVDIMTGAWEQFLGSRRFAVYELANERKAFCHTGSMLGTRLYLLEHQGRKIRKGLIGYKTVNGKKRYWHFAVSARPFVEPTVFYALRYHVGFSSDQNTIWQEGAKVHKARRSQCRDWWNDDWLERMLCFVDSLKKGDTELLLPVGEKIALQMETWPEVVRCPVSFIEPSGSTVMGEGYNSDEDDDAGDSEAVED